MTRVQLSPSFRPRSIRHVFMDWDGTTSLTRGGWAEIMVELFAETLPPIPGENVRIFSRDELMRLNGRPSIHQMARLAELVTQRGGAAQTADDYQHEYQAQIGRVVEARLAQVRSGAMEPDALLIPGVRAFFTALNERGIPVSLVSGTPHSELIAEVRLLGLEHHFAAVIGPSGLDDRTFSKRETLRQLIERHALDGSAVLALGDGPVELIETRAVGGVAVAVAADEADPERLDPWKRDTLLAVGADAVIANFRPLSEILATLFP